MSLQGERLNRTMTIVLRKETSSHFLKVVNGKINENVQEEKISAPIQICCEDFSELIMRIIEILESTSEIKHQLILAFMQYATENLRYSNIINYYLKFFDRGSYMCCDNWRINPIERYAGSTVLWEEKGKVGSQDIYTTFISLTCSMELRMLLPSPICYLTRSKVLSLTSRVLIANISHTERWKVLRMASSCLGSGQDILGSSPLQSV